MTGMYAHTNGLPALVNHLNAAGYETVHIGLQHERVPKEANRYQTEAGSGGDIDYSPTLLEAAGAPIPPVMQGRSFWPLLVGGAYLPHDAVVTERHYHGGNAGPQPPPGAIVPPGASHTGYDPMRSVRTPRFHYIRNLGENPLHQWLPSEVLSFNETFTHWYNELWPTQTRPRAREELFDTLADSHETRNLADDPVFESVQADLSARLDQWMKETGDPLAAPASVQP